MRRRFPDYNCVSVYNCKNLLPCLLTPLVFLYRVDKKPFGHLLAHLTTLEDSASDGARIGYFVGLFYSFNRVQPRLSGRDLVLGTTEYSPSTF